MEFISQAIQDYAENHSSSEPKHLYELNRYTHSSVLKPRMLSGHLQGRFLSMMSHLVRPIHVLDIGTYTGYSALCLAEGLSEKGRVYTLDNNEEMCSIAEKQIQNSPYASQIQVICGDAIQEIIKLQETGIQWDLIWMDADKAEYPTYYETVFGALKPGGLIMADNVLWSGKILSESEKQKDKDTRILHEFNEMVKADERTENILMPIRDGIMMIRKK